MNSIRIAAIAVAAFALGLLVMGIAATPAPSTAPDITIMACSAWADTQYPVIPDYTFTGACLNDDGTYSVAN